MASKKVGTLIKDARTQADLTQEQLARKIKSLSANDISLAERGQKDLTQAQLKAIAKATGVTQASLLNAAKGTTAKKTTKASTKTTSKKASAEKKTSSSASEGDAAGAGLLACVNVCRLIANLDAHGYICALELYVYLSAHSLKDNTTNLRCDLRAFKGELLVASLGLTAEGFVAVKPLRQIFSGSSADILHSFFANCGAGNGCKAEHLFNLLVHLVNIAELVAGLNVDR